jgi:hypothetical protein
MSELELFIQGKIADAEWRVRCREQGVKVWSGGSEKSWRAVGCGMSKLQRLATAEKEARILVEARRELHLFKQVFEALQ